MRRVDRRGWLAAALVLLALPVPGLADVVSKGPDAVAVTIYRDHPASAESLRGEGDQDDTSGLAMITEERWVDLPAGRTRIEFQGVADAIIPASARLDGLPGGVVERNFDYDLLGPGSLIERSVGREVVIRRANPRTGQTTETPGVLSAGPDGVMVTTAEGVVALDCGAGPEALIFDHLPEGLADKPTLSVTADAPVAGRYKLELSYLAVRIDWAADYVARVAPDGKTLSLTGWLTLSNRGSTSFGDAPTEVVAGELARVPPDLPSIQPATVQPECWPMGTTTSDLRRREVVVAEPPPPPPSPAVAEMVVTARRQSIEKLPVRVASSNLGEYKLYTLAEPTTVAANQTKQIRFLEQPSVKFDTLYVLEAGPDLDGAATPSPTWTTLAFRNKEADGLGLPLPAGRVSVRQPQVIAGGRELFVGEPELRDTPVGEDFELRVGEASDVEAMTRTISDSKRAGAAGARRRRTGEVTVTNARPEPATFELRIPSGEHGLSIAAESARHTLKNGSDVWRLAVPAGGTATLTLTLETGE